MLRIRDCTAVKVENHTESLPARLLAEPGQFASATGLPQNSLDAVRLALFEPAPRYVPWVLVSTHLANFYWRCKAGVLVH